MTDNNWKKNIILFLVSQTISLFGSSLVQYAITWYITLKTQSGSMMTLAIICGFLPTFFLSPFAGVLADRYDRKKLMALADGMIAVATLILAIVFMMGYQEFWLIFLTLAVRAVGSGIQTPAVGAVLPQIVPEEKLGKVNAVNGSIQSFVMLAAPMVSGALLSITSIEIIFFIDVLTAIIGISTLMIFVKVPLHEKAKNKQEAGYFKDFKDGMVYINKHKYIKNFFIFCTSYFFLVAPGAFLTPLQVTRSFGNEIWKLTAVEVTFSIGMILGGLLMTYWKGFKNKVHTMALSSFVIGACTFLLGIIPSFWIYLGIMIIFGVVMPVFDVPSTVLLQEKVEEEYLGRIFGVFSMTYSSMMPLGMLLFGPLSDIIKIESILLVTGTVLFAQSFFLVRNKALIEAGKPKVEEVQV